MSAHQFEFTAIDGATLPLRNYAEQTMLIVNTASGCEFTPQFDGRLTIAGRTG